MMNLVVESYPEPHGVRRRLDDEIIHLSDDGARTLCGLQIQDGDIPERRPRDEVSCGRCTRAEHGAARIKRLIR